MRKIGFLLVLLSSLAFATVVSFNGIKVTLNSDGLNIGDDAPVFIATNVELEDTVVGGQKAEIQVLAFVPSLDTGTCALETIAFNKKVANMRNVELTIISKDLPFAQKSFCTENKINNIQTVSDYKDVNNAKRYGTTISSPAFLEGFFGRVIYIVDTKGKIAYVQVVNEIANEPNYKEIMNAINNIDRNVKAPK